MTYVIISACGDDVKMPSVPVDAMHHAKTISPTTSLDHYTLSTCVKLHQVINPILLVYLKFSVQWNFNSLIVHDNVSSCLRYDNNPMNVCMLASEWSTRQTWRTRLLLKGKQLWKQSRDETFTKAKIQTCYEILFGAGKLRCRTCCHTFSDT